VTWIASAITDEDRAVANEHGGEAFDETWQDGSPYRLRLVAHDPAAYDLYYNVVANPTLWFVQHYMWGLVYEPNIDDAFRDAWANGYARVNQSFADAIVSELDRRPGTAVFLHDYHLYLTPRLVRDARPDAVLSHFIHIPWPETDYWHVLPRDLRCAIHDGVLANDILGLHTHRWQHNALWACEDLCGADVDHVAGTATHRGRTTRVTSHPIGIDPAEFVGLADSQGVLEQERQIVATRPEFLVVRVDRTDPSKNIVRGFRAFALFLEQHPELGDRVEMLALLDPSRQDVRAYSDYLAAIEDEVRGVNERFGRAAITLRVGDNFMQSVAAYKQYDALLVNPVFDGLNLVSKEAPLVNTRDGVLILSENAGSHEELHEWALTVNPFDIGGQAAAIHAALTMAVSERRRRSEALRACIREHDVRSWIAAQLADLDRV
jgi:trehalose 6-phosphate synthase